MNKLDSIRNLHDFVGDSMSYVGPFLAPVLSAIAVYAAFSMLAVYIVAVYGILVTTHLVAYTMAFPLLTIVGATNYAITAELDRQRQRPIDDARQAIELKAFERERMAEARAKAKALSAQASTGVHAGVHGVQSAGALPERKTAQTAASVDDLRVYDEQNPGTSVRDAATALGRSPAWVSKWRGKGYGAL